MEAMSKAVLGSGTGLAILKSSLQTKAGPCPALVCWAESGSEDAPGHVLESEHRQRSLPQQHCQHPSCKVEIGF